MIKRISKILFATLLCAAVFASSLTVLSADGITVTVDNRIIHFPDQQPILLNGRTYVPVRFVAESFDAEVSFEDESQTVTIAQDEYVISLQVDNMQLTTPEGEVEMDVAPVLLNDRVLIPIRFVVEALSGSVDWDNDTQTVVIMNDQKMLRHLVAMSQPAFDSMNEQLEGMRIELLVRKRTLVYCYTIEFDFPENEFMDGMFDAMYEQEDFQQMFKPLFSSLKLLGMKPPFTIIVEYADVSGNVFYSKTFTDSEV